MIVVSVTPGVTAVKQVIQCRQGSARYSDRVGDGDGSSGDAAQRAAFEARAAAILAMDDLTQAFEEAGKLVNVQIEFRHDAAQVRAEVARRIKKSGELSIGQLAQRLGLSKARTDRMLRRTGQPPADDK